MQKTLLCIEEHRIHIEKTLKHSAFIPNIFGFGKFYMATYTIVLHHSLDFSSGF